MIISGQSSSGHICEFPRHVPLGTSHREIYGNLLVPLNVISSAQSEAVLGHHTQDVRKTTFTFNELSTSTE